MNKDEIRRAVLRELQGVAPEADVEALDPDSDFRDELDIDSMDVLRFVTGLHGALGVSVPEADYRRIVTVRGCTEYVAEKLGQAGSG
jgi:acyl carrier protein